MLLSYAKLGQVIILVFLFLDCYKNNTVQLFDLKICTKEV